MANAHLVASSSNFPFASDTHYPLQELDVLTEPVEMSQQNAAIPDSAKNPPSVERSLGVKWEDIILELDLKCVFI